LSFDVLDAPMVNYAYTFIHCDANWVPSELAKLEYMSGMTDDLIQSYDYSRNTRQRYMHYDLVFPNENIRFNRSGNYVLLVYDMDNDNAPVITRRFMIYEDVITVAGSAELATRAEYRFEKQEIDFSLFTADLNVIDPYTTIKVAVLQNNRWDNAILDLKPRFVKGTELEYNYNSGNLFDGGNEFRFIDAKNLNYRALGVERVAFEDDTNRIYLEPDERRSSKSYLNIPDINGRFVIRNDDRSWDHTIDADYTMIYFRLPVDEPFNKEDIYVFGELSAWNYLPGNRMIYNYDTRQYELGLMLKQGYYNYQYIALPFDSNEGDVSLIEGNHSATENEYTILVYYRRPGAIFDRLVGWKSIKSRYV
jgi:hypothetical protein